MITLAIGSPWQVKYFGALGGLEHMTKLSHGETLFRYIFHSPPFRIRFLSMRSGGQNGNLTSHESTLPREDQWPLNHRFYGLDVDIANSPEDQT